ncbi:MAG TPA: V-type ATP synthase subunit C [Bacillota bacterium]|nr:V-type ATP synthase subunit C [Clostridiaceae bacterium]HNR05533.1 V-type ATP synthase subunit C [Bacillota bacterium]HNT03186.1 V-type ATP synthase subunit C [Bacillota bacterium]HPA54362.1 V-type ATP synthase subunit C [Bacillota bacterium]HPX68368.1 V-type ATP synthase subunit C [Bacillota bacterium]
MSENKYLYSVTRIRALETKLLDKAKIERMIEARNADEIIKILYETEYANSISEMKSVEDYESVLSKELSNTYKLLSEISPVPELTNLFQLRYDIHNLKTLLKSSYLDEENDELLSEIGTIPIQQLKGMIKEKVFSDLDPLVRESLEEVVGEFTVNPDPQLIDVTLDKALYKLMYKAAKDNKSSFLTDYISTQIDLINIKSLIRVKSMGYGREFLKKVILENGKLDYAFFSDIFDESLETLIDRLAYKDYGKVVEEGISNYIKTKSLTKFEKLSDDFIFELAKKGKFVAFGIEPLIGYLMAKENETKIIRMIMVGKINEIPNELIRERLRDVYV